jgi:hypothetical protein
MFDPRVGRISETGVVEPVDVEKGFPPAAYHAIAKFDA